MANHTKNMLVRHAVHRLAAVCCCTYLSRLSGVPQVGCGGKEAIDQSHFVGAVYGMENIMGRRAYACTARCKAAQGTDPALGTVYCADDNPVRKLYNKAWADYCSELPMCWMQTVCAKDEATQKLAIRGFYTGTGYAPFVAAAELALKVNFEMLDEEVIILSAPRSAGNRCAACETGVGTTDHKGSCLSRPRGIYHDMVNMHGIWCVRVE
jgi:hypothetical protein